MPQTTNPLILPRILWIWTVGQMRTHLPLCYVPLSSSRSHLLPLSQLLLRTCGSLGRVLKLGGPQIVWPANDADEGYVADIGPTALGAGDRRKRTDRLSKTEQAELDHLIQHARGSVLPPTILS